MPNGNGLINSGCRPYLAKTIVLQPKIVNAAEAPADPASRNGMRISPQSYCGAVSAVESQVVGYTTANVKSGKWNLIAAQFETTASKSFDIQEFITSSDMIGGDYNDDTAPNLKLWNGTGYIDYYFWEEDWNGETRVWCDGGYMVEDIPVDLGHGAFFKAMNDCTINVAGQVAPSDSLNVPLTANKYNLICNPFPVSFDINGTKASWADALIGGDYTDDNAPNMKLWNGSGYIDYYFWQEDWNGETNVWCDGGYMVEDIVVNPFSGFWLKYTNNPENVNLKFNK